MGRPHAGKLPGSEEYLADFSASPLTLGSNEQTKASGQQGALTPARLGQAVDRICTMWVASYNQEAERVWSFPHGTPEES